MNTMIVTGKLHYRSTMRARPTVWHLAAASAPGAAFKIRTISRTQRSAAMPGWATLVGMDSIVVPSAFLDAVENLFTCDTCLERNTGNIKWRCLLWFRSQDKTLPVAALNAYRTLATRLLQNGRKVLSCF